MMLFLLKLQSMKTVFQMLHWISHIEADGFLFRTPTCANVLTSCPNAWINRVMWSPTNASGSVLLLGVFSRLQPMNVPAT